MKFECTTKNVSFILNYFDYFELQTIELHTMVLQPHTEIYLLCKTHIEIYKSWSAQ